MSIVVHSKLAFLLMVLFATASWAWAQETEKQPDLKPKALLKMTEVEVSKLMGFQRDQTATPKDGYAIYVLILEGVEPDAPVGCPDISYLVCDKSGTSLESVAFGFPIAGSKSPVSMIGKLAKGKVKVAKKTEMALFFVGSASLKDIEVKTPQKTSIPLSISKSYEPPQELRIDNVLSNGRINFLSPSPDDNWSVK